MNSCIRRLGFFVCVLFGLYAAYIGLISLNIYIGSDIRFRGMMLLEITEWMYSIVLEHAIFFWVYAFTLFSMFHDGFGRALAVCTSYVFLSALRYCVLMWLGYIRLWASTVNFVLEMVQYAAVILICFVCVDQFNRVYRVLERGHARMKTERPARLFVVYPQKSYLVPRDPFRLSAAIIGFGFGIIRVVGRIIQDVTIGAPSGFGEILNMVIWYTIDILIGFAAYYAVLLIVKRLSRHEMKKENG